MEPEPSTQVTLAPAATVVAAAVEISTTTQQLVTPSPQLPEIPQRPILPFKDANFTVIVTFLCQTVLKIQFILFYFGFEGKQHPH